MSSGNRLLADGSRMSKKRWEEARKRAIASKDPICAICGKPIDMEAPPCSPMSCEVDHIIPISRGGDPYDIDNLQLTHCRCNRQKGARINGEGEDIDKQNLCPCSNNW